MTLPVAALAYRMGYGYWLITSPVTGIIAALVLVWIDLSGLSSGEGKYDERSFYEMNAAYIVSLVVGIAIGALSLRRLFG